MQLLLDGEDGDKSIGIFGWGLVEVHFQVVSEWV